MRLREETARQRQALLSEHSLARFDEDNRTAVRAGLQAQVEQADAVVGASIQSAVAHAAQVRMLCWRRLARIQARLGSLRGRCLGGLTLNPILTVYSTDLKLY